MKLNEMPLPQKLRTLRALKRFTRTETARLAGLTERQYAAIETGALVPPDQTLQKLAEVFGVAADLLLGRLDCSPTSTIE